MTWSCSKSDANLVKEQRKDFISDYKMTSAEDPAGVYFLLGSLVDEIVFLFKSQVNHQSIQHFLTLRQNPRSIVEYFSRRFLQHVGLHRIDLWLVGKFMLIRFSRL
jgi:hypothetical protein